LKKRACHVEAQTLCVEFVIVISNLGLLITILPAAVNRAEKQVAF